MKGNKYEFAIFILGLIMVAILILSLRDPKPLNPDRPLPEIKWSK